MKNKEKNSDAKKMKAITHLVKHGYRGSEWEEAGLLNAIEQIIDNDELDLSSQGLEKLKLEAGEY
jgi:hypothetical protein